MRLSPAERLLLVVGILSVAGAAGIVAIRWRSAGPSSLASSCRLPDGSLVTVAGVHLGAYP